MKLLWNGAEQYAPGLGVTILPGEHDYPDEAADTLRLIGLKDVSAPTRRKSTPVEGEKEL
jgi:hypothetical protein